MDGRGVELHTSGPGERAPAPGPEGQGRWLSPIEETIMAVVGRDWMTAREIGEKTGQALSASLYAILANLADREILESSRSGYRLAREEVSGLPPA